MGWYTGKAHNIVYWYDFSTVAAGPERAVQSVHVTALMQSDISACKLGTLQAFSTRVLLSPSQVVCISMQSLTMNTEEMRPS